MAEEDTGSGGFQGQRRLPFKEKKIEEITQSDIKVRISGMVIEKSGDLLMVDDGSGQVKVMAENTQDINLNQKVRVFGRVIPVEGGVEVSGEIIQDMADTDMELYKKVIEAEKNLGV